jgi:hypothetical protein
MCALFSDEQTRPSLTAQTRTEKDLLGEKTMQTVLQAAVKEGRVIQSFDRPYSTAVRGLQ